MLHLLLAGLVMISGSQTTTTTTSHSRIDPVRGSGVVFKVGVQVTHSTPTSPVTLLSAPSNPLYCLVRRKINGMEIVTFVRIQRPQLYAGACQPWRFIP
jgi:hypothetical protein